MYVCIIIIVIIIIKAFGSKLLKKKSVSEQKEFIFLESILYGWIQWNKFCYNWATAFESQISGNHQQFYPWLVLEIWNDRVFM